MPVLTITETNWTPAQRSAVLSPDADQTERIQAALGRTADGLPKVDEDSSARYYAYLSAHLSLPFAAYYPEPKNAEEEYEFRCIVLELLDPRRHLGDVFDGIFCRIRKGNYELNLPLVELHVPHDSPDYQLIEDYWHWFCNWR